MIAVPLDYSRPAGDTIQLSVIRKTATGERLGSLFINPGGPGASGYDLIAGSFDYIANPDLQSRYDIYGWDPRGVGRSSPVRCLGAAQLDQYLYGVPVNVAGSDAWLRERLVQATAFAASCVAGSGALIGHVDATSTARDLDILRAVSGDRKLNYLGFSYGTVYGTAYAELFPSLVGRMVLDGAIDPTLPEPTVFTAQMAGFDSAYRAFLANCVKAVGCPFSGSVDEAAAQSSTLFAEIAARTLRNPDGRTLTAASLGAALAYPLYDRAAWPTLSRMITGLKAGDPTIAFSFADTYNDRERDGSYSSNTVASYTAELCLDGAYSSSLAGTKAELAEIQKAAPIVGIYLAYSDWALVDTACQSWPHRPLRSPHEASAPGAPAILVLGTTNDPATPYAWAESLAAQLHRGVLVTRKGEGHTAYAKGNDCIDSTVDRYLIAGAVPTTDPNC